MQLNSAYKKWLNDQKITDATIKEFGLYGTDHIVFPVKNFDGEFTFNKYRRSPLKEAGPKYWYDGGGKVTLYGGYKAKDFNKVLVTEGEKDTLVAWSHNIPAVSSTGGAQSFQEEWADFFKDKEVVLCFDNDEAGAKGMVRALKIVPHATIIFLPDRPGIKDISDYVLNGGDLNVLMQSAQRLSSVADVYADRSKRLSVWQNTYFHDAFIAESLKEMKKFTPKNEMKKFSSDAIENAKLFPIPDIIDLNAQGKAICPFHKEDTPSLQYYEDNNSTYCFGSCGKRYDAINIYMKVHGCDFKEALNQMNKRS